METERYSRSLASSLLQVARMPAAPTFLGFLCLARALPARVAARNRLRPCPSRVPLLVTTLAAKPMPRIHRRAAANVTATTCTAESNVRWANATAASTADSVDATLDCSPLLM